VSDLAALALLFDAWDDYWKAGEAVDKHGVIIDVKNREGVALVKANPAVAMKADAWRRVLLGMSKFGLDPSSSANLSVTTPKERNPFDEFDDPLPRSSKGKLIPGTRILV
jgi:P27 family predicted phage terminase small subunit